LILLIESLSLSGRCGEDSDEAQAIWGHVSASADAIRAENLYMTA
jgi:hypothetical protein